MAIIGYTYKRNLSHSKNSHYQRLFWASQVAQWQRIRLPMQEPREPLEPMELWVLSLDQEDPLEEEMASHSSILAWKIPRTEEPGGLCLITEST